MKQLLVAISLFASLSLSAQSYRYSYTPNGIDSVGYELDVRKETLIIGIGDGSPLVIPFEKLHFDLKAGKNVSTGRWRCEWDDTEFTCYEGSTIRFVLTNRKRAEINVKRTFQTIKRA
jgi:hypothetical protein